MKKKVLPKGSIAHSLTKKEFDRLKQGATLRPAMVYSFAAIYKYSPGIGANVASLSFLQ